jgi:hypothetical protein
MEDIKIVEYKSIVFGKDKSICHNLDTLIRLMKMEFYGGFSTAQRIIDYDKEIIYTIVKSIALENENALIEQGFKIVEVD